MVSRESQSLWALPILELQHWCLPSSPWLCRNMGHTLFPLLSRRTTHSWPCFHPVTPPTALSVGGEAPGAGEASFTQHAQEAHCMSPGPARGRSRQALCKCPPSPGQFKTCLLLGPCLVCLFIQPLLCLRISLQCGSPSHLFLPLNPAWSIPTLTRQGIVPLLVLPHLGQPRGSQRCSWEPTFRGTLTLPLPCFSSFRFHLPQ